MHGHGKVLTKVVSTKMGKQEVLVELLNQSLTLREKCPYLELLRIRMQENVDKDNSEYEHFSRSVS